MMGIPAEISVTELTEMLGIPRKAVSYRLRRGAIPYQRLNPDSPRSKRVVLLSHLRTSCPDLWEAIVFRAQAMSESAA